MTHTDERPARPLPPTTFHILLSLTGQSAHGYHIKRMVEDRTDGAVQLGAGTLYASIQRMVKDGLIEETDPPDTDGDVAPGSRWRFYAITRQGRDVLRAEVHRLESDLKVARALIRRPG